ncbi:glycoside hydrolase [Punctularia strigosozonata HHB-11173 SS5]|uniref:Glycoside hydrolase n=1 Tax=Punctularia strigosozonata (strain HHB-11173) TaxID=741275 RepID=R7RZU8_PUNST|nr:glycoside hydrolase [Punctularia strigosozonata HHB-11173 SS5]EIN03508.1 glycoside hydrolase [Punctularia strigosozonata HHB-11173 SS5]
MHIPRASSTKAVVAHFIVGYTYSYSQNDWFNDINLASSMGIDAFALNLGADSWQPSQIANAYSAASSHGSDFKLFLSFDMSSIPCGSGGDASNIGNLLNAYANHGNQFYFNGRPYTSTFGGEGCAFGTGDVNSGWTTAVRNNVGANYYFVPAFFGDPNGWANYAVVDGVFNWNGGWPMSANDVTFDSDAGYISAANGKLVMSAVSPWFFAHYSWKNEVFDTNDWLWNERWEQLVQHRDQVDVVQILTWNDYSESHYVGPVDGSPPDGTYWQNGFDHQGFLNMVPYYSQAFKTGNYPTVSADHLFIWSRPHPAGASACCDGIGKPANADWLSDYLWAVAFAASDGSVTLTSGSNTQTFSVTAGVNKLQLASSPGGIQGTLTRDGKAVVDVDPGSAFTYTSDPQQYNYNAFVAWA